MDAFLRLSDHVRQAPLSISQNVFFPVMEFLDISLTKDSSLLLRAIHSSFYWQILKKTILFYGFENPFKKIREQDSSILFMNSIL
jgi:hypothetical protein